jgi:hypothetical protein
MQPLAGGPHTKLLPDTIVDNRGPRDAILSRARVGRDLPERCWRGRFCLGSDWVAPVSSPSQLALDAIPAPASAPEPAPLAVGRWPAAGNQV